MLPTLLALAFAPRTPTPPVCITVPTNGRPEFLPHALRMISEQNYAGAIHVVVVDDSPEDLRPHSRHECHGQW